MNEDGDDGYAKKKLKDMINNHIRYGEYITVYFNTETNKLEL